MFSAKTLMLGALLASATLVSVPPVVASPQVPVVPSAPGPIGPTRGERAVASANNAMRAIAVAAVDDIRTVFIETNDTLGSITASLDVHQRALRIAKTAIKVMKSHQTQGRKELKAAYKDAKLRVRDAGGTVNDLEDLKIHYQNHLRHLTENGGLYSSAIYERADAIYL